MQRDSSSVCPVCAGGGSYAFSGRDLMFGGDGNDAMFGDNGNDLICGNAGGDWTGCLAGQLGVNGNFAADPLFCDPATGESQLSFFNEAEEIQLGAEPPWDLAAVKVQSLQNDYWSNFFEARVDREYVESRRRVGQAHARIGLELQSFFSAMNIAQTIFMETLYDGYVVNAIMDACYRSARSRAWEPVELDWRGGKTAPIGKEPEIFEGEDETATVLVHHVSCDRFGEEGEGLDATPAPVLEPPGNRSVSQGLRAVGNGRSP